jgi:hypothetical protein
MMHLRELDMMFFLQIHQHLRRRRVVFLLLHHHQSKEHQQYHQKYQVLLQ